MSILKKLYEDHIEITLERYNDLIKKEEKLDIIKLMLNDLRSASWHNMIQIDSIIHILEGEVSNNNEDEESEVNVETIPEEWYTNQVNIFEQNQEDEETMNVLLDIVEEICQEEYVEDIM